MQGDANPMTSRGTFHGIVIAGISGIHSPRHFTAPHPHPPYPVALHKAATYYNQEDLNKILKVGHVDIFLLHNWPDLMNDARDGLWPPRWGRVGCEHLTTVLRTLRPRWVFCGHMHHRARHSVGPTTVVCLPDFCRNPGLAYTVVEVDENRHLSEKDHAQ